MAWAGAGMILLLCVRIAAGANPPNNTTCACVSVPWRAVPDETGTIQAIPSEACQEQVTEACFNNNDTAACELYCMYHFMYKSDGTLVPAPPPIPCSNQHLWSPSRSAQLLGAMAEPCNEPCMTEETIYAFFSGTAPPVWDLTVCQVSAFTLLFPSQSALPPNENVHTKFYDNQINGAVWMSMEAQTFYDLNILTWGDAFVHKSRFTDYIEETYRGPPKGPDGGNVSVFVSLERLVEVDPPKSFSVQLSLSMSWYDPRISKNCKQEHDGAEVVWDDVCTVFWKPSWTYPTALDSPSVVEDYGTTFYVGADSAAAATDGNPGLNRSFGTTSMRLRADFITVMDYSRYPYDTQTFKFSIQAASKYKANEVVFHSAATSSIDKKAEHQVWDVRSFSSDDGQERYPPGVDVNAAMEALYGSTFENPNFAFLQAQGLGDGQVTPEEAVAYSEFVIDVRRYCGYYLGNYVVLEAVLVFLGWITFFMAPDGLDSRLGIALTLVLAINVFQIVLVENLPETGYLTDLSLFTICNTVLLSLIAIETVLVCEAYKRVVAQEEMVRLFKVHVNNPESIAAATRIQRKARLNKARNRFRLLVSGGLLHTESIALRGREAERKLSASVRRRFGKEEARAISGREDDDSGSDTKPSREPGRFRLSGVVVTMQKKEEIQEQPEGVKRRRLPSLVCRVLCSPFIFLDQMVKIVRVKKRRWVNRHSRFIAFELDRLSAFVIFPLLFLSYFLAIFLRGGGGGFGNCSQR